MKNLFATAMVAALVLPGATKAFAGSKIVYGEDNRLEVSDLPDHLQKIAKSTAGMVNTFKLVPFGENVVLPPSDLKKSMNICPTERFSKQLSSVTCSGFLVGPDLLVTAGHCISTQKQCDENSFVFDFQVRKDTGRADAMISKSKVYKCKRVIDANHKPLVMNAPDFSLIQLERVVEDRAPLEYNVNSNITVGDPIYVIGHPSGLPAKFADGANVTRNNHPAHFQSNLDTFGGNSGSAVFNAMTDKVEGILVKGGVDYTPGAKGCRIVNKLPNSMNGKAGEQSTKLSAISTLKYRNALIKAAMTSDIEALSFILRNIVDMNIYDNNGNTALHVASALGNFEVVNLLLQNNVDITIKNLNGETALDLAVENSHQEIVEMLETLLFL